MTTPWGAILTGVLGELSYLRQAGFDVILVGPPREEVEQGARREHVALVTIPIEREIAPWRDLVTLWRMCLLMRRLRPQISTVGMPKAGLIGGLAAWLNRVPCRVYNLHGLRMETTVGLKRWVLAMAERIACRCAHRVVCASHSLRGRAVELGLVDPGRAVVLGTGSLDGVDPTHFAPTAARRSRAAQIRRQLRIPDQAPVLGYVGRLTLDKGVVDLVEAFGLLRARFGELRLLVVGPFENGDPVPAPTRRFIETDSRVAYVGYIADPHLYYHVMDILVLPSYREGFPTAILEAGVAGKPVVAARATGTIDAVVNGVTGILVPPQDPPALAAAVARLLTDSELAERMGREARRRAESDFRSDLVWAQVAALYRDLLRERGLVAPAVGLGHSAAPDSGGHRFPGFAAAIRTNPGEVPHRETGLHSTGGRDCQVAEREHERSSAPLGAPVRCQVTNMRRSATDNFVSRAAGHTS